MGISSNYQYWRNHGHEWTNEYKRRQRYTICYHIQKIMLADYMRHSQPARVLEFGCGVGRHLQYLCQIDNIEVYGYDQSATMVKGCLEWTTPEWISERIAVGEPVGRLPYPDKHFDIVYTVEVLIHVSPTDLSSVLSEIVRVSNWQVLHVEPSLEYYVHEDAHDGSWNHDIVAAYHHLGYTCEPLQSGFRVQQPYRVILDHSRPVYTWSHEILRLLWEMESDIQPTIDQLLADTGALRSQLASLQEEQARGAEIRQRLEAALAEEQQKNKHLMRYQSRTETFIKQLQGTLGME